MNKIINKNLIFTFAVLSLILSFSFVKTVSARTVSIDFGAANSLSDNNGNNDYNNNNQNDNLVPVITSISPSYGTSGASAKAITINGYNFVPSSVTRWNGSDRNTDYINSHQLIMYTTNYDMSGLGNYYITVYNHTSNGGLSNTKIFTLRKPVVNTTSSTTSNTTKSTTASTVAKKSTTTSTPACSTASTTDTNNDNSSLAAGAIFGSSSGFLPNSFLQWLILAILVLLIVVFWRKVSGANKKYQERPLKHA